MSTGTSRALGLFEIDWIDAGKNHEMGRRKNTVSGHSCKVARHFVPKPRAHVRSRLWFVQELVTGIEPVTPSLRAVLDPKLEETER